MGVMDHRPDDLDPTRATIADRELVPTASGYLTSDVAMALRIDDTGRIVIAEFDDLNVTTVDGQPIVGAGAGSGSGRSSPRATNTNDSATATAAPAR